MSDTKASTFNHEDELRRFESNPVGHTVQLLDGSRSVVAEYRDTPKGRWYRLRRAGWVPAHEIEGVVVFTVGLRRGAVATDGVPA